MLDTTGSFRFRCWWTILARRDCDANTMAIPLHNRMTSEDFEYSSKLWRSFCR